MYIYVLSCSVVSDSLRPQGLQPTCPWVLQARILKRVAISFSNVYIYIHIYVWASLIAQW